MNNALETFLSSRLPIGGLVAYSIHLPDRVLEVQCLSKSFYPSAAEDMLTGLVYAGQPFCPPTSKRLTTAGSLIVFGFTLQLDRMEPASRCWSKIIPEQRWIESKIPWLPLLNSRRLEPVRQGGFRVEMTSARCSGEAINQLSALAGALEFSGVPRALRGCPSFVGKLGGVKIHGSRLTFRRGNLKHGILPVGQGLR